MQTTVKRSHFASALSDWTVSSLVSGVSYPHATQIPGTRTTDFENDLFSNVERRDATGWRTTDSITTAD